MVATTGGVGEDVAFDRKPCLADLLDELFVFGPPASQRLVGFRDGAMEPGQLLLDRREPELVGSLEQRQVPGGGLWRTGGRLAALSARAAAGGGRLVGAGAFGGDGIVQLSPRSLQRSGIDRGANLAKQPEPTMMDYGACKAGLLYLTKALAKQYVPKVRVNAVLPGPVWTRMWSRPGGLADQLESHYGLDREKAIQKFLEDRQLPLGIGQPDDVANTVAFLASPVAKFITGANVDIGGTIRGLI